MMVGVFEVGRDFIQLQRSIKDLCEDGGASWSAQVFRQAGVLPSGPCALLLLFFLKTWHTSSSLVLSTVVGERGVAGGVNGCIERWSGRVWGDSNLQ